MKSVRHLLILTATVLLLTACSKGLPKISGQLAEQPDIFPDYIGVTIPPNIAPLNFSVNKPKGDKLCLILEGAGKQAAVYADDTGNFDIPAKTWRKMLEACKGGRLQCTVCVRQQDKWLSYKSFDLFVAKEPIDPYLAYRLIPPGYGLWGEMGIYQRNLENYDQTAIMENRLTDYNCMNCHSFPMQNPDKMVMHMRAKNGGTLLKQGDEMEKLDTKTPQTISALVYPYWHPSERFIAFSTNKTAQAFFRNHANRIEVYDSESDVVVYDVQRHEVVSTPLLMSKDRFETFPCFTPDGKWLYFCSSAAVDSMPNHYKQAHYDLCRISFDARTRSFGKKIENVFPADSMSVSFPRISPDGRFLVFTRHHFGNFSIWHKEADLWLLDLRTGQAAPMTAANSPDVESYHSWSHNGRWLVFSSRRGNSLYTRPYFTYIDAQGKAHKAFLLPQKNPREYYGNFMFSYNIPELITGKVKTDRHAISKLMREGKGTQIKFASR